MGKCPDCNSWDSLEEHTVEKSAKRDPQRGLAAGVGRLTSGAMGAAAGVGDAATLEAEALEGEGFMGGAPVAEPLAGVAGGAPSAPIARLTTGVGEFDRVLGGGFVPGSAALVGGDPGIGKSTLLLQALAGLSRRGVRCLYVSSEESVEQVRLRATRLGDATLEGSARSREPHSSEPAARAKATSGSLDGADASQNLWLLADTNLARIVAQAQRIRPAVMVIDSIQMIYHAGVDASPGTVSQLRRCCTELVYLAKASGVAVVLVGHVTKEGALAGPRLLEHLVDAVLYFEGDRHHGLRVVRAVKNRFGTTLEIGLFEMTGAGLVEVRDASGALPPRGEKPRPGAAVVPTVTGSRCMLVEVQALTATGFLGAAKRKASGLDPGRLAMLIAVLEAHAGLRLADRDVFAQAVGGVRVVEPAADLALALAIAGAHFKRALPPATCAVGEVGLGGEIRPVTQMDARLLEASRLGYTRVITAPSRGKRNSVAAPKGVEVIPARTITEAIDQLA